VPRGFKRDEPETKVAYEIGRFHDAHKRSFVTLPKRGESHVILAGVDVLEARLRIYERDKGRCQLRASADCKGWVNWNEAELEHKMGGNADRCWCDHNLRISCRPCHVQKHGREPRWKRSS
jgi:hypothetical protein